VALRLGCTQPVKLKKLTIAGLQADFDQAIYLGDVVFTASTAICGIKTVEVQGELFDGSPVSALISASFVPAC